MNLAISYKIYRGRAYKKVKKPGDIGIFEIIIPYFVYYKLMHKIF